MKKIVMKFGGTSVGTGENIRHVANLVKRYAEDDCRVVVVVSALGGVTDKLLEVAQKSMKGDEKKIQASTKELAEKHLIAVSKAIVDKRLQEETENIVTSTISELKKVLKLAGIKDVYSKSFGHTKTKLNLVKACFDALKKLTKTKIPEEYIKKAGVIEGEI